MKLTKRMKELILICAAILLLGIGLSGGSIAESSGDDIKDPEKKAAWVVEHFTDDDMTEEEKALALHDWLTDNAHYDLSAGNDYRHAAAGVLIYGSGVCDSYSKAYELLLTEAGIESKRIVGQAVKADGTAESHAWNLVKMDGAWYQVDVTWDDPVDRSNPTAKRSGLEHHLYFKASKRFMNEEHKPNEEGAKLIASLVKDDGKEPLPPGVDHSARHNLTGFSQITTDNVDLAMKDLAGKDMILVYGRIACLNTRAFLSDISPYMEHLSRRGVQVLVSLYDDPTPEEMKSYLDLYPGIRCAKLKTSDRSMWNGLEDFGYSDGSVIFPVIFLKNSQNKLTYCSTNYVQEPLKIVSGALEMAREDEENPGPAIIGSGTCGEAIAWELSDDGLLNIIGTGDMWDYTEENNSPWTGLPYSKIVINPGVTSIGDYAFYHFEGELESVSIPNGVISIGDYAFVGKLGSSLENIEIPEGVISIGDYAFCGTDITELTVPDSVTEIGEFAFLHCNQLECIQLSNYLTCIQNQTFSGCVGLAEITIPESVTKIGQMAFYDCRSLQNITIPDSVTETTCWGLSDCSGLTSVKLSKNMKDIEYGFFSGCSSLESIIIPEGVERISGKAFMNCSSLKSITIPDSVWYIDEENLFTGCEQLSEIIVESSDSYAYQWATENGYGDLLIVLTRNNGWSAENGSWFYYEDNQPVTGWKQIDDTWYYFNPDGSMATGWVQGNGNWYLMNESGAMTTGWVNIGGVWYCFRDSGIMATGWVEDNGSYYYMNPDGSMATGWIEDNGAWYYLRDDGTMYTGWLQSGSSWYLLKPGGAMAVGWEQSGDTWYYFKKTGAMASGEWIEDLEAEARQPADQKRPLWYWFDSNGIMATGWKEIGQRWEFFSVGGEWLYTWDGN